MKEKNVEIEKDDTKEIILDKLHQVMQMLFSDAERSRMEIKKYVFLGIKKGKMCFEYNIKYSQYSIKFKNLGKFWMVECISLCENNVLHNCYWNTGKYICDMNENKVFCFSEKRFYDEDVFLEDDFKIIDEMTTNYEEVKERIIQENENQMVSFEVDNDEEEIEMTEYNVENIVMLKFKLNRAVNKDFENKLKYLIDKYEIRDYEIKDCKISNMYSKFEEESIYDSYLNIRFVDYRLPFDDFELKLIKDIEALLFGKLTDSTRTEHKFYGEEEKNAFLEYRKMIHEEAEKYVAELKEKTEDIKSEYKMDEYLDGLLIDDSDDNLTLKRI